MIKKENHAHLGLSRVSYVPTAASCSHRRHCCRAFRFSHSKMGSEIEKEREEEEEDIVCLDESFFVNDDYQLTSFTFGSNVLELYCLQSASTDFDLTGQLVWPGAMLMNGYLSDNADILQGCSVLEFGSGVGITGVLCSKFCRKVVFTDHNDEVLKILKKNIELHEHSSGLDPSAELEAAKLEWGNSDHLGEILQKHSDGFDLILGADIYILILCLYVRFQQSSVPLLFDSVEQLLRMRGHGNCKFILAYVSRARQMDSAILREGSLHGMLMNEVPGTRCTVGNLEGVIFEITLK
ncbi:putative methyltransferase family protein [Raphanus sativus]|nr:putative methyltransferase family protein [Raphanus sativus]